MHSIKLVLLSFVIALAGCASYNPIPEGYSGPIANIADSGIVEDGTKAQVFALTEIDGNRVGNSFIASAQASQGRGFSLTPRFVDRGVPIRPMKLTLRGSHVTAAPIQAMALQLAGRFYSVEGIVDFTPSQSKRYVVRGELAAEGSSVWLEDEATGEAVTAKIGKK